MTGTSGAAALAGATVAGGLLLIAAGLRPTYPADAAAGGRSGTAGGPQRVAAGLRRVWPGRRRAAGGVVAGFGVLLVTGWPVAALTAAAAVVVATGRRPGRVVERQLARLDGLEAWTRRLADLLGAGAGGLEQAVAGSVRSCPAPIQAEVAALAGRWPVCGVEAALRRFADDLADVGSPAPDVVAAALILRVRRGGRGLRPVLAALADDVADLVRARRAVEADRAKPRANARTLTALTLVVLVVALLGARDYLTAFATPTGQLMLAVIAGLFTGGYALMARITRPPAPVRLLSATVDSERERSWV